MLTTTTRRTTFLPTTTVLPTTQESTVSLTVTEVSDVTDILSNIVSGAFSFDEPEDQYHKLSEERMKALLSIFKITTNKQRLISAL